MKTNTLLLRLLTAAIAMIVTMPAWGQTLYNPEIAYTQVSGKSTDLYLANRDGSRAFIVHSTPHSIGGLDFAPGGNRIAFQDPEGIKVLHYSASNTGISVSRVQLLVAGNLGRPDFSPDGTRILYRDGRVGESGAFQAVNSNGGTPVTLLAGPAGLGGRWLRSDTFGSAFAFGKRFNNGPNVPETYEIWIALLNANGGVDLVGPMLSTATQSYAFSSIVDFDISHTRDALLMSVDYPVGYQGNKNILELDLGGSGAVTEKAGRGHNSHYSADDSRIIYRSINSTGTTAYVQSHVVATGVTTPVFTSRKGLGGVIDARP